MKNIAQTTMLIVIGLSISNLLFAQNELWYSVEQMKVLPGKNEQYLKIEREYWKPYHLKNINQGKLNSWMLYKVLYTGTNGLEYQYIIVETYNSLTAMNSAYENFDEEMKKIHPEKDTDKIYKETGEARIILHRDIFKRESSSFAENFDLANAKYAMVGYMSTKPHNIREHIKMEKEIFMPTHKALIQMGQSLGWSHDLLIIPQGSKYPYNNATVHFAKNLEDFFNYDTVSAFKKAHPDKDINEIISKVQGLREIYEVIYFELIDFAVK